MAFAFRVETIFSKTNLNYQTVQKKDLNMLKPFFLYAIFVLLNYDIYQSALDDDNLFRRLALECFGDLRVGKHDLFDFGIVGG